MKFLPVAVHGSATALWPAAGDGEPERTSRAAGDWIATCNPSRSKSLVRQMSRVACYSELDLFARIYLIESVDLRKRRGPVTQRNPFPHTLSHGCNVRPNQQAHHAVQRNGAKRVFEYIPEESGK